MDISSMSLHANDGYATFNFKQILENT